MTYSVRMKFFIGTLLAILIVITGLSATYFVLTKCNKAQEAQQLIHMAFRIILASLPKLSDPEAAFEPSETALLDSNTLRIETHRKQDNAGRIMPCETFLTQHDTMDIVSITRDNQAYYQGQCTLKNTQGDIEALTISLSQKTEREENTRILMTMLAVSGIFLVVGGSFVLILTLRLLRPVQSIASLANQIAQGNVTEASEILASPEFDLSRKKRQRRNDEFIELSRLMHDTVTSLQDITLFAENFSRGEALRTITPKSEHDIIGRAFYNVSGYISHIMSVATAIANGDLRQEFQPKSERDILGTAFHKMQYLRQMMSQIMDGSQRVREASDNLAQISPQMASDAEQASQKVHLVSATSHQINGLVESVAAAIEEFSVSVREISNSTSEVASMVTTAVDLANSAQKTIADLEIQSQEIGDISKVITSITQQTNLLALNATIEAARAGESGKGFVVVANEVKTLAKETAISAEDITQKITTMQSGSQNAVTAISEVSKIITQIHGFSRAIAASVEQQSATTHEISLNISEAASGTGEVTESIKTVASIVQNTSIRANQVQKSAEELNLLADRLQQLTFHESQESNEEFLTYYRQANINWKAYEGTHLTIGLNKHPFTDSLRPLLPVFERLTGIQVTYSIFPEEEYFKRLHNDLSNGSGLFDVYMTSPMFEWHYQDAGWIEDLNTYYHNPELTDQGWYDRDDFFEKVLQANMWDGTVGGGLGRGRWNGIPIMVEFYLQAFREDLRQKWALQIPKTYPELLDVTKRAAQLGKHEIPPVFGIAERGTQSWATIHSGYFTAFSSYGQRDITPDLYAAINTPKSIEITKLWVDMLQQAGDPGWPNYNWYNAQQNFSAGKFYAITDADILAVGYEDPTQSNIAGKVGYTLPPAGPDGTIRSNMWTWSLGISSFSKQKEAAWLFLLWATASRSLLKASLKYGNINPSRKSVWESSELVKKIQQWGARPGEYRNVVEAMYAGYGGVAWTPNPEAARVGDIWAEALREAYRGKDVKAALDTAAEKINELMAKWRKKR